MKAGERWMFKRQVWTFYLAFLAAALAVWGLVLLKPEWIVGWGLIAVATGWMTRVWTKRDPMALPYALRWVLLIPRPFQSAGRVKEMLGLRGGEHLLEIGPGTGRYSLPVATALDPSGTLEVLDIQQPMLDHLMRHAARARIANIMSTHGDAAKLPYPDARFDGAFLMTALGEIADQDRALRELHRVLKPDGCLVIGEIFFDPDFISLPTVRRRLDQIGFVFERKSGPTWAYLARFGKRTVPS